MLITPDVATEADELQQSRTWLRGLLVPKVLVGVVIVLFFILLAAFGPLLDHTDPGGVTRVTLRPPSLQHWLGTTQQGQDVLSQVVHGARISMEVGFGAGILTTIWSVLVGLTGGYIAGTGSELLSLFSNVFLVIPSLPLVVILASYLPNAGSAGIIIVITVTGWAWGARVLRAQTLSLRRRDFVEAARATGENSFKIMLWDILPNELAIITATFLASVVGAILTEASIAFLGLSNVTQWSWGTMLYWAQVSGAELARAWWWFVPPGLCIALVGTGLAFINFGIDDVINPRLRSAGVQSHRRRWWNLSWLAARFTGRGPARPDAARGPVPGLAAASATAAGLSASPVAAAGRTPAESPVFSSLSQTVSPPDTVLELRHLSVEYGHPGGTPVRAVNDVTLTLHRGEVLGIAGESGSGKSTLARAVTRLLRPPAGIVSGEMIYTDRNGRQADIVGLPDKELRQFRWEEISIVFQSAMNALNPVLTLGAQLDDVLQAHRPGMRKPQRAARVRELLQLVGISPDRASAYPHELSGGMRQRSMIAMGLALDPEIIVMDEPTTALDVVIQRQVIETISGLKERLGFSVIFITHDLSLLIELCDTIAIMYGGRIVESAPGRAALHKPAAPLQPGAARLVPDPDRAPAHPDRRPRLPARHAAAAARLLVPAALPARLRCLHADRPAAGPPGRLGQADPAARPIPRPRWPASCTPTGPARRAT